MSDMEEWDRARDTLRRAEERYLGYVEDGMPESMALESAIDGCAGLGSVEMLRMIWAGGALDTAWEAAQEEIGQAMLHDVEGRTFA